METMKASLDLLINIILLLLSIIVLFSDARIAYKTIFFLLLFGMILHHNWTEHQTLKKNMIAQLCATGWETNHKKQTETHKK